MDCLTSLPPELLDEIQELVHAEEPRQYLGLVHRVFLPTSRRIFFRHAEVWDCWGLYWDALKDNQACAHLIRALDLRTSDKGADTLRRTTRLLVNLEGLDVDGPLAHIILSPLDDGAVLPHLKVLRLTQDRFDGLGTFDPRQFRLLDRYKQLDALLVNIRPLTYPKARPQIEYQRFIGQLPADRSWFLQFEGELLTDPSSADLLHLFPIIDTLRVIDTSPNRSRPTISSLFASISRPASVTALSLSKQNGPINDALPSLHTFPNLFSLELSPNTFLSSSLPTLSTLLSLSRLVLLRGANVSTADIKPLFDLPSLRTLRLDLVYKPSESFFPCNPLEYPGWTPSFTFEGVGELIDLADEKEVKLIGLAVGLVTREREYEARWGKKHA